MRYARLLYRLDMTHIYCTTHYKGTCSPLRARCDTVYTPSTQSHCNAHFPPNSTNCAKKIGKRCEKHLILVGKRCKLPTKILGKRCEMVSKSSGKRCEKHIKTLGKRCENLVKSLGKRCEKEREICI